MTSEQALGLLSQLVNQFRGSYEEHIQLREALRVLQEFGAPSEKDVEKDKPEK